MALLEVRRLAVELPVEGVLRPVLHDVSLELGEGEALGLVGESGSGKSMTARAIIRLLPPGARMEGEILFDGASVGAMDRRALRRYRTRGVAMISQDPRAHVNPVRTTGDFLTEALRTNLGVRPGEARARALALLEEVRVDDPPRRMGQYPHELSGGLLQRMTIAAALAVEPRLLLADEPTTALDVTTQAEVMAILDELRRERGLAMLFITHDLDLAAAVCDRTAVMYAGTIVEQQPSASLHERPLHPYTAGLARSRPSVATTAERLEAIPGVPLSAFEAPAGCPFAPRCVHVEPECRAARPPLRPFAHGAVACRRAEELHERGALRSSPEAVEHG